MYLNFICYIFVLKKSLTDMTKEQINKIIDERVGYFINGHERGFIKEKELNDMRYAISKVREDINKAFENV